MDCSCTHTFHYWFYAAKINKITNIATSLWKTPIKPTNSPTTLLHNAAAAMRQPYAPPCRAVTPWQPHKTIPYKTSRDAPWHVSTNERHKKSCQTGLGSALTCAPRLTTFLFQASSSCNGTKVSSATHFGLKISYVLKYNEA